MSGDLRLRSVVYLNLINGEIDLYLGPLRPAYEGFDEKVLVSEFPPVQIELRSYFLGDKPAITTKEDLSGKKVSIIRGFTYGGLINYILEPQNQVRYQEIKSFDQAVRLLQNQRVDYHLDYRQTGDEFVAQNRLPNLRQSTLFRVDLYFMVSRQHPQAELLLQRLQTGFLEIKEAQ